MRQGEKQKEGPVTLVGLYMLSSKMSCLTITWSCEAEKPIGQYSYLTCEIHFFVSAKSPNYSALYCNCSSDNSSEYTERWIWYWAMVMQGFFFQSSHSVIHQCSNWRPGKSFEFCWMLFILQFSFWSEPQSALFELNILGSMITL